MDIGVWGFEDIMKNCKFKDRVIDYIEGLMDNQNIIVFENHLKECGVCREELSAMKKIYEIMNKDTISIPEKEFFEKLKNKIRQQEIIIKNPLWKILGILAPVLGVLIFVLLFNLRRERSVEIAVSISNLAQDEYLNTLLLERIVDNNTVNQFNVLEEYFTADIEQGLKELTADEKKEFIKIINEKYGEKYL